MKRRTGYVQDRGSSFRISYYDLNHIRQFETFRTRDEAERELAIRLGELAKGLPVSSKPNTVTFEELAGDVVNDYIVSDHRSMSDIETRFRLHLNPVFGKRKASQITTAQIKTYIVNRKKAGAATGTINRELEAMKRAFNLAISGRKLMTKPHIKLLPEQNTRKGFFTREEVDRLCGHLKTPLDSFVLFGFLTGWRYSEIQGLLWRNVDFTAGEIRLDAGTTKNDEARVFSMTDELSGLLNRLRSAASAKRKAAAPPLMKHPAVTTIATSAFVFTVRGKPVGAFRKTWKTACHKAGLPCVVEPVLRKGKPAIGKDGKPLVRVVKSLRMFHDLRRSAAREMENQGVPRSVIKDLMGHKTDSMFTRYRIVSAADKARAAEIINDAVKHASSEGHVFDKAKKDK